MHEKHLKTALFYAFFACFLAFLSPVLAVDRPPAPPTGSVKVDTEMQKLRAGQVIINDLTKQSSGKIPTVEAKIMVPKPADVVRKVVGDPQKIMKSEKKVKKLTLLSKSGNTQMLEYTVMLGKMLPTFNYVLRHQQTSPDNVQFKRVSGSFKDFDGGWKVTPVDSANTVLTYRLRIDPGPGLPKALIGSLIKADLPRMMQNAKAAIVAE